MGFLVSALYPVLSPPFIIWEADSGHIWGAEVFDRTGSYRLVFIISAILALFAILFTLAIKEKKHRVVR